MRPTSSTTVQRPDLGQIAYEFALEESRKRFIGLSVLPIFNVQEMTADYPKIPLEALLKLPDIKRAPKSGYTRDDFEWETGTYRCEEYGFEEPLDEVERKMYAYLFDAEKVATLRATEILLRSQELRIKNVLYNTNNFTAHAITNEWDDSSNATPKADVKTGVDTIRDATGIEPNAFICSRSIFDNAMITAEIKDYIKYTQAHLTLSFDAQKNLLAQYLGLEKVLVGDAVYDAGKKGKATSTTSIWGTEYAMIARVATQGWNPKEPCVGRSLLWTADSPTNLVTEQYYEEQIRSDVYRVRHNVDEVLVFPAAAYLMSNMTT
ncbi:MAG TPA: hypothetical protein PLA74_07900 [Syntrophales bacterium]|nr:hypothetical protein [Syntrophales bacterium]